MADAIFAPAFGNRPSHLVGRDALLDSLMQGIMGRPGAREKATVLLGQRGLGKTVLLWELADRARAAGYVVASPTVVSDGMLNRIIEKIQQDGERYVKDGRGKLVGGTFGALGFTAGLQFSTKVEDSKSFGFKLLSLAKRLGEQGRGILILVDELQASSSDLRQLIISYAELVGEQQDVSIVLAGLPGAVSSVLNDRVLTFLNRANRIALESLHEEEIDAYYSYALRDAGLSISTELRRKAAHAVQGSPYMLQLVGHYLSLYAGESGNVEASVLQDAIEASKTAFERDVCETTLASLSDRDIDFLKAMSADAEASRISDIAQRMGVTDDYAQKYRKRLIESGIIKAPRRGHVRFAVPYLASYLRQEHGGEL
ncbi:MAG TPA: ATP-binding protein [Eggerthellaceae bacterium]|nr:ATP-binding protein [Eggerthellaceae bacterium]